MSADGNTDSKGPVLKLSAANLAAAVSLVGDDSGAAVHSIKDLAPALKGWQEPAAAAGTSCKLTLRVAFFFDGTDNNMYAHEPTHKNSNVARLYRAHHPDDPAKGLYHFYLPGIGTYFPEISDTGGGSRENAMGAGGDARLGWAMQQLRNVIAKHPADKIVEVRVCAFGFSRGAGEARAFASKVQEACIKAGPKWHWKDQPRIPMRFYFLGLFDTVCSVGLVQTTDSVGAAAIAITSWKWVLNHELSDRRGESSYEDPDTETPIPAPPTTLLGMAYGPPGADAGADSNAEGHWDWGKAKYQTIHDMVEKCVHFAAGHEQRNSFPCDTVRQGDSYPANCEEYVYPGVHSDVGGGYQPGELGVSVSDPLKLSQIPLLHMHALAIQHDVPFYGINEIPDAGYKANFDLAPDLHNAWTHYMGQAGLGGKPLGQMVSSHYRLFFQWRFRRIHLFGDKHLPTDATIQKEEKQFAQQGQAAQAQVDKDNENLYSAQSAELNAPNQQAYQNAQARAQSSQNALDSDTEKLRAVPSTGFAAYEHLYDKNLMKDISLLQEIVKRHGSQNLRPHYKMLLETYDNEFNRHQGLSDQSIVAFFDNYVHDSLAAFAKDVTLPSDPRSYFMGGDNKIKYAEVQEPGQSQQEVA